MKAVQKRISNHRVEWNDWCSLKQFWHLNTFCIGELVNSHFPKVSWLPNNWIAIGNTTSLFVSWYFGLHVSYRCIFPTLDMRKFRRLWIFFSKRPGTTVEVFVELLEEDRGQALRREILKARLLEIRLEIMSSCELAGWKPTCKQQEVYLDSKLSFHGGFSC